MAEGQLLLFLCAICVTTRVRNFIVEVSYTRLDSEANEFFLSFLFFYFFSLLTATVHVIFWCAASWRSATYLHLWRPLASSSPSISVLTENSCVRSIPGNVYRKTRGDSNEHKKAKKQLLYCYCCQKVFSYKDM